MCRTAYYRQRLAQVENRECLETVGYRPLIYNITESFREEIVASYVILEKRMRVRKQYFVGDGIVSGFAPSWYYASE